MFTVCSIVTKYKTNITTDLIFIFYVINSTHNKEKLFRILQIRRTDRAKNAVGSVFLISAHFGKRQLTVAVSQSAFSKRIIAVIGVCEYRFHFSEMQQSIIFEPAVFLSGVTD